MKKYRLVRIEDGQGFCPMEGVILHEAGGIWTAPGGGQVFYANWLSRKWESQWLYWHLFYGVPNISDNSTLLGYRLAKLNEQEIFCIEEVIGEVP